MANLEPHIRRMYADIVSYRGGFGDGVDHGPYNPFEMAAAIELTSFERAGVSVAVLHWIDSAAENSTWEDAVVGYGSRVRNLLAAKLIDHEPLVRAAAEAFLVSEDEFIAALGPVYERVVKKWAAA